MNLYFTSVPLPWHKVIHPPDQSRARPILFESALSRQASLEWRFVQPFLIL